MTFGAVIAGIIIAMVVASGEPRSDLPKIVYAIPVIIGAWLLADWFEHRRQTKKEIDTIAFSEAVEKARGERDR